MKQVRVLGLILSYTVAAHSAIAYRSIGGSGHDVVNAVAIDRDGYVWVAGTSSSFDFPVHRGFQTSNRGTQLAVSDDAGAHWRPLGNLASQDVSTIIADPRSPGVLYAGANDAV